MSAAANKYLRDKPLLIVVFSFISSMILVLSSRAMDNSKEQLDSKANKTEVQLLFNATDIKINQNVEDISKLEQADIRIQTLFLNEIKQLRTDLNLKQNKD